MSSHAHKPKDPANRRYTARIITDNPNAAAWRERQIRERQAAIKGWFDDHPKSNAAKQK